MIFNLAALMELAFSTFNFYEYQSRTISESQSIFIFRLYSNLVQEPYLASLFKNLIIDTGTASCIAANAKEINTKYRSLLPRRDFLSQMYLMQPLV